MGRLKPAWWYQRQQDEAEARETYYRTRTPPVAGTTVTQKNKVEVYYRSQTMRAGSTGSEHAVIKLAVSDAAPAVIPIDRAGLFTKAAWAALTEKPILVPRPKGFKPNRLFWYKGRATPVRKTTAWNTGYIKYAEDGTAINLSMPLSKTTGSISTTDITGLFELLAEEFTAQMMGTKNGRCWLDFEDITYAKHN